jgi:hypothetical protein
MLGQLKSVMAKKSNTLQLLNLPEEHKENQELMLNFIKNNNLIFCSANYAGSGKSALFEKAFENEKEFTMFIVPTNNLGKKYKKEGFHVKTVHSFLGLNREGIKRNTTIEENILYAKLKYIVVDEIFTLTLDFIQRLEYWRRNNIHIKFYSTGDDLQLPCINPHLSTSAIKSEIDYIKNNLCKLYPNNIHQKEIKRFRLENGEVDLIAVERMKKMKEEIFDEKYEWNETRIKHILRDFQKIAFNDIRSKQNICFLNNTARKLNSKLIDINGGFKVNETIFLCKKRLDLPKQEYVCFVNYEYLLKQITDSGYELYEELEEKTFTITKEQYTNHLQPNFTMTNHGLQGVSIPKKIGKITILDLIKKNKFNQLYCSRNFLYVALSRCVCIDNIQICYDDLKCEPKNLSSKIEGHKKVDMEKGIYDEENFISEKWFYIQLNRQQFCCASCEVPLILDYDDVREGSAYSINRIYNKDDDGNHLGHTENNCNIVCNTCQCSDKFSWREDNKEILGKL